MLDEVISTLKYNWMILCPSILGFGLSVFVEFPIEVITCIPMKYLCIFLFFCLGMSWNSSYLVDRHMYYIAFIIILILWFIFHSGNFYLSFMTMSYFLLLATLLLMAGNENTTSALWLAPIFVASVFGTNLICYLFLIGKETGQFSRSLRPIVPKATAR